MTYIFTTKLQQSICTICERINDMKESRTKAKTYRQLLNKRPKETYTGKVWF